MSINGWIDKEDVLPIYNGILFGREKEGHLEDIMLSKISQAESDK